MIKINEEYYINADPYNIMLCKKGYGVDKAIGKPPIKAIKYLETVEDAFAALAKIYRHELIQNKDLTIQEAIDEFRKINNELLDILSVIKKSETFTEVDV